TSDQWQWVSAEEGRLICFWWATDPGFGHSLAGDRCVMGLAVRDVFSTGFRGSSAGASDLGFTGRLVQFGGAIRAAGCDHLVLWPIEGEARQLWPVGFRSAMIAARRNRFPAMASDRSDA
ncbi:hypothetical protein ACLOJK_018858, partial [Asimina triloba]